MTTYHLRNTDGTETFTGTIVPAPGGGSQSGAVRIIGPVPLAFNTADVNNGIAVYTPEVGDILVDAWFELLTVFDGTTPVGDFGPAAYFTDVGAGIIQTLASNPVDLSGGAGGVYGGLYQPGGSYPSISLAQFAAAGFPNAFYGFMNRFTTADPLLAVISQDGKMGGAAVGGAAGAANVYVAVATPAAP